MNTVRTKRKRSQISETLISVLIVTENDEKEITECVQSIFQKLKRYQLFEILIIDNASNDATIQVAHKLQKKIPQIRVICLSKKHDFQVALTAGFDTCIGDYVITFNIYLDDPKIIATIIRALKKNDVVLIENDHRLYHKDSSAIQILKKAYSAILRKPCLNDPGVFASGYTRSSIVAMTKVRRKNRFSTYLASLVGLKQAVVRVNFPPPQKNKFVPLPFFSFVWYLIDASISNSFRPLRLVSLFSLLASILNVTFILYVFIVTLVKNDIAEGWITTSLIMGTMFFVLFFILTVISEYILRILQETREEPLYFIAREIDGGSLYSRKKLNVDTD